MFHNGLFATNRYPYEMRMASLQGVTAIEDIEDRITALTDFVNEELDILNRMRPPLDRSHALDSARRMLDRLQNPMPPIVLAPHINAANNELANPVVNFITPQSTP